MSYERKNCHFLLLSPLQCLVAHRCAMVFHSLNCFATVVIMMVASPSHLTTVRCFWRFLWWRQQCLVPAYVMTLVEAIAQVAMTPYSCRLVVQRGSYLTGTETTTNGFMKHIHCYTMTLTPLILTLESSVTGSCLSYLTNIAGCIAMHVRLCAKCRLFS